MSLTTLDKQDIKGMIDESIQSSPIIRTMSSDIKKLELSIENLDFKTGVMFEKLDSKIDGLDSKTDQSIKNLDYKIDGLDSKMEILFEDLDSKIDTVIEIVGGNADVKKQVKNHEGRLTDIESVQPLISKTLALHSKQLGAK